MDVAIGLPSAVPNAALLPKQALSLNALSNGRFTLGIGLGGREDDYELSGIDMEGRRKQLDALLERSGRTTGLGSQITALPGWWSVDMPTSLSPRAGHFGEGWIAAALRPASTAAWSKS